MPMQGPHLMDDFRNIQKYRIFENPNWKNQKKKKNLWFGDKMRAGCITEQFTGLDILGTHCMHLA